MTAERLSVDELAARWAACIASAERPVQFSSRDGTLLRLVATNERLSQEQLKQHLKQLLTTEQHLSVDFSRYLSSISNKTKACRHLAAWARGWCYLQAGNCKQAFKDANTALAYAASASAAQLVPGSKAKAGQPPSSNKVSQNSAQSAESVTDLTATRDAQSAATQQETAVAQPSKTATATAAVKHEPSTHPYMTTCTWPPALLLAAECLTALEQHAQAVILLSKAAQQAPDNAIIVADRITAVSRQLTADQSYAWSSGGVDALMEQLKDEAEMKLPEVLRPRPKWYYYNKWMTQRIHTALLELHLGCPLSGAGISEGTTAQQMMLAAQAAAEAPAVAAAAEAAGFLPRLSSDSIAGQQQQQQLLQLPGPIVDKLLLVDAGDLDLLIKHPTALQAQVYELLDVYEAQGTAALQDYTVPHLIWEEVQALAAASNDDQAQAQLVGLPLGYSPPRKQHRLPAGVAAVLPAIEAKQADASLTLTAANASEPTALTPASAAEAILLRSGGGPATVGNGTGGVSDDGDATCAVVESFSKTAEDLQRVLMMQEVDRGVTIGQAFTRCWRQQGWKRSDYLLGHRHSVGS